MDSGTLSGEEFGKAAEEFVKLSTTVGDNWRLETFQIQGKEAGVQILTKKTALVLQLENDDVAPIENALPEIEEKGFVGSVAPCLDDPPLTLCNFEYHVVHSCSYSVPVLYFNAYKPDGQLLTLKELWNCIPDEHKDLTSERWNFVTQQEHPLLHRPFFQLHPCHTSDLMRLLRQSRPSGQIDNYLVTWLSSVGPVVHLHLPLEYASKRLDDHETKF